jgi:hypothetical protein
LFFSEVLEKNSGYGKMIDAGGLYEIACWFWESTTSGNNISRFHCIASNLKMVVTRQNENNEFLIKGYK